MSKTEAVPSGKRVADFILGHVEWERPVTPVDREELMRTVVKQVVEAAEHRPARGHHF
jgi:hypothetical protein